MFTIYKTDCFIVSDNKSVEKFFKMLQDKDSIERLRGKKILFIGNDIHYFKRKTGISILFFLAQYRKYDIDCALLIDKNTHLDKRAESLASDTKDFNI